MNALEYHEVTKHHFNRFARSAGHLDWATQPDPFRRFAGAALLALPHDPIAAQVSYDALFDGSAPSLPVTPATVAELLRCSMGLSAWKQYESSRWALRVNPSSGNLHPTEAYIVWNGRVWHYAPREHALEERCVWHADDSGGRSDPGPVGRGLSAPPLSDHYLLVGLTSILWREAWKYGERAFRYCQHDLGHALGALRLSAARLGWDLRMLTEWSDEAIATLLGLDRDQDFADGEREVPECLALIHAPDPARETAFEPPGEGADRDRLLDLARRGTWAGVANRLSRGHVEWPVIDAVAAATVYPGVTGNHATDRTGLSGGHVRDVSAPVGEPERAESALARPTARTILLQRRSAVAFDGRSALAVDKFRSMLARLRPEAPLWQSLPWPAHVHLALFVHRVDGLPPGIYAFLRDVSVAEEWQRAMRPQFIWEPHRDRSGTLRDGELFLLLPFDMTWPAARVSCDQDIAGDGFFSLGMIARVGSSIRTRGEWFYRRLFWEAGLIGQVLYLEAEAANARATGIGCYYDDAVHELLGLQAATPSPDGADGEFAATRAEWQSLYHFSMGRAVDDTRLTTEPGYEWERVD